MDSLAGYKTAAVEELPHAVTVMGPLTRRLPRQETAANASNRNPWGVEAARVTRSTVSDA